MDLRHQELTRLKAYTDNIDKEVTLLLQNLQWDPKLIIEKHPMVICKCDSNHKIPLKSKDIHERQCHLTKLGYRKEDTFLPDPVDPDADTLVKFSNYEIADIINTAAADNPFFKRGVGWQESEPLTAERLQSAYSADERRVIHDAVVDAAPFCHDLTGLDLSSSNNESKESQRKSRLEILAELRNMKRRRTKYRVAPKTRNYSDVLRDVIKTQMDMYGETTRTTIKTDYGQNVNVSQSVSNKNSVNVLAHTVPIKLERESPEPHAHNAYHRDNIERYRARSRDKRYNDKRAYCEDNFSSKEKDSSYNESRQSKASRGTEKRREMRYDNDEKRRLTDKYSSKERTKKYGDHLKEHDSKDQSQEKRFSDERSRNHADYPSRDRSRNYGSYRKDAQTKHVQESEAYSHYAKDYDRDRSGSKDISSHREQDSKKKHSNREKRYSPDNIIKQESIDSDSNVEPSRKRHKSRSKEKKHKNKKARRDKDNKSSRRDKVHDSRKRKHEFSPEMVIKQEKQSP